MGGHGISRGGAASSKNQTMKGHRLIRTPVRLKYQVCMASVLGMVCMYTETYICVYSIYADIHTYIIDTPCLIHRNTVREEDIF